MYKILTLNQISTKGLDKFPREDYEIASEFVTSDAVLVRSHKLQPADIQDSVLATFLGHLWKANVAKV